MTPLFLAQSDTTVGFLCQDSQKINQTKQRGNQKVLIEVDSLERLQTFVRVPQKYKNQVRRSKKTTFIYPNGQALRVVHNEEHLEFLSSFGWFYSSSANMTQKAYDDAFAQSVADVVVWDKRGLFEGKASKIIKINTKNQKRIR
ncbi:Sua5 YciO YrdC YwlC family protein [Helicobacter kayseriensis]|uniref:Sua5 YciO YrdC YwlC family protein n=1 Tax=Helicobacter kayseriensis TaxID=2905877 RepID=UPI001E5A8CA9|nr:Sua5 YciO YrdC YwlC family protein [Helicobacter kayseriensis]MCE3046626.1 Sua5 YciO YrdC YwlC family protein [Helicobacter kayseriensis]MCE3048072.1 Sua5 YciO YrdC YwlC family protein [Helicobacter kayseriensis]